jgi:hypothetical protein
MFKSAPLMTQLAAFVGLAIVSFPASAVKAEAPHTSADQDFPPLIEATIDGRSARLKLTGTALRKKVGIEFYRIAGYCDAEARPADVDAVACADVPKQLILVMQRDVADWILQRSFQDAFEANDFDGRYSKDIEALLAHMGARRLKKGDRVILTHLPQAGVECRVGDDAPWTLRDRAFAEIVWNVFMGPRAVSPDLRRGLGTLLSDVPQSAAAVERSVNR